MSLVSLLVTLSMIAISVVLAVTRPRLGTAIALVTFAMLVWHEASRGSLTGALFAMANGVMLGILPLWIVQVLDRPRARRPSGPEA